MTRVVARRPWAVAVVAAYVVVAALVAAGVLAPDPEARVGAKFLGSGAGHWLGTDRLGRDILSRVLHGAYVALLVGGTAAATSAILGSLLGLVAGWFRGALDAAISWLCAVLQAVPSILLLVALSAVLGRGRWGLLAALSLTFWVPACRVVRGEVLRLRELPFVDALRTLGYGPARILAAHVFPSVRHLVLVNASLVFVSAVKAEVLLSYLGLGLRNEPSWGTMIQQARGELINGFYWQIGAASVALFTLVLALHLTSEALEVAFDPRSAP